jgi:hypothetical protein
LEATYKCQGTPAPAGHWQNEPSNCGLVTESQLHYCNVFWWHQASGKAMWIVGINLDYKTSFLGLVGGQSPAYINCLVTYLNPLSGSAGQDAMIAF